MLNQFSSPTLEGCVFTGNLAFVGGGLSNFDSSPTVSNSNFCGNAVADIGFEIASQIDGDPIAGEEAGNCIAIDCGDCEEGDGDSVDSCVGDINADGFVDSADLGLIIGSWEGPIGEEGCRHLTKLVNPSDLRVQIDAILAVLNHVITHGPRSHFCSGDGNRVAHATSVVIPTRPWSIVFFVDQCILHSGSYDTAGP